MMKADRIWKIDRLRNHCALSTRSDDQLVILNDEPTGGSTRPGQGSHPRHELRVAHHLFTFSSVPST